ncbi:hypothetical protein F7734_15265 [Scytonema sp. UIC 10036]|uniref:hypothetical protein n=1 Tax=Scytonema sp. UIC 10036 TaxID=2304196 RepID=UPI0012DA4D96|nr:hypothetical protein [Scytonema sp. UIC 10036]MUG93705.1 hypothetical protein [Scytonema sp. UIC 10036]
MKTKSPTPLQILAVVKQILASPQYRQKAQLISAEIARYDTPTLAVNLLEQLAETKQPVLKLGSRE